MDTKTNCNNDHERYGKRMGNALRKRVGWNGIP